MAKKPRAKKVNSQVAGIIEALKFIEPASKDIGQINQTHCMLANGYAAAFDGLLMMGAKIDTEITAYPHTRRLLATLSRCDEAVQITQLDGNRLGVKSGKFSAFVPCIEPGLIQFTPPDPPLGVFNEAVVKSLECAGVIAKENAPRMVAASVLLRANSAIATDGVTLFEHWHGLPFPDLVLPKAFISVLMKITKKPVQAGGSPTTFTVWFEDQSFIRTQLYVEAYPTEAVDKLANSQASPYPIPDELWPALAKLDAMKNDKSAVYFNPKATKLQTDHDDSVGGSYEFDHPLPDGLSFNIDFLRRFQPYVKTVDWNVGGRFAAFYGDNFRGMLAQRVKDGSPPVTPNAPGPMTPGYEPGSDDGDEIPY